MGMPHIPQIPHGTATPHIPQITWQCHTFQRFHLFIGKIVEWYNDTNSKLLGKDFKHLKYQFQNEGHILYNNVDNSHVNGLPVIVAEGSTTANTQVNSISLIGDEESPIAACGLQTSSVVVKTNRNAGSSQELLKMLKGVDNENLFSLLLRQKELN